MNDSASKDLIKVHLHLIMNKMTWWPKKNFLRIKVVNLNQAAVRLSTIYYFIYEIIIMMEE